MKLSKKANKLYVTILNHSNEFIKYRQNSDQQRITKLEEIYSQIPKIICLKNCGKCCGLISMSKLEESRIILFMKENNLKINFNNDPLDVTFLKAIQGENRCYFLSDNQNCIIYPVRPIICRLYGVAENMVCQFSKPDNYMTEDQAIKLIKRVKKI